MGCGGQEKQGGKGLVKEKEEREEESLEWLWKQVEEKIFVGSESWWGKQCFGVILKKDRFLKIAYN